MTNVFTVFARNDVTGHLAVVDMDLTSRQAGRLVKKLSEVEQGEVTYYKKDVTKNLKRKGA